MISYNRILSFKQITAAGKVRDVLQQDAVFELIRCLYASDIPYAVETSYIPVSVFPEMTEELIRRNGLYKTMQSFSIVPERAVENLTAVPISREDALLLDIHPSDTAIRNERTTYSKNAVIEYTVTIIKSDFFSYTVELD